MGSAKAQLCLSGIRITTSPHVESVVLMLRVDKQSAEERLKEGISGIG